MPVSKFTSLKQAVEIIQDRARIAIGGFTVARSPMAFVYEMIRQKKRELHLYGHSPGVAWDMLIGAGCVKRTEVAYESDDAFGNVGPMFRRAIQEKKIEWEDYSNFGMICRFMAGAMGLPFFPIKSQFGSDILNLAGFSESLRKNDTEIAREKMHIMQCPFTGQKVILVPTINVDVSILHVQQATTEGTIRIYGQNFGDVQQALCAKKLIITCEEVVEPEVLRNEPERNQIPFFRVDHLVHVPFGAHPRACSNYYDYDPIQFKIYHEKAKTDQGFKEYLNEFVYSVKNHEEYLSKIGDKRLSEIKADPALGYRADLKGRY